jgi:hypothetical protein
MQQPYQLGHRPAGVIVVVEFGRAVSRPQRCPYIIGIRAAGADEPLRIVIQ